MRAERPTVLVRMHAVDEYDQWRCRACPLSAEMAARMDSSDTAGNRSFFVDIYAEMTKDYMRVSGAQPRYLAGVVVKNQSNGAVYETQTNGNGQFTAPNLPPGSYEVAFEAASFKRLVST